MNDNVIITGTVVTVLPMKTFGNGLNKQVIRVETEDDKYPQTFDIEAVKDKISLISSIHAGQTVSAHCNLKGRLWEAGDRCFTTLSLWKIEVVGGVAHKSPDVSQVTEADMIDNPMDDEVPF
jgi:hypothetical protein